MLFLTERPQTSQTESMGPKAALLADGSVSTVEDLPGGASGQFAGTVDSLFVNGVEIVADVGLTTKRPGGALRSGANVDPRHGQRGSAVRPLSVHKAVMWPSARS